MLRTALAIAAKLLMRAQVENIEKIKTNIVEVKWKVKTKTTTKRGMTKQKQSFIERDFFLLAVSPVAMIGGFNGVAYGQISNILVAFFRVSYVEVDWLSLGLNVGPFLSTVPLSWMMASKFLKFRMFYVGACFIGTAAYCFLAISVVKPSLFSLMICGQLLNSFAGAVISAAPTIFAAL